jgi:probable rRNA maturation factor
VIRPRLALAIQRASRAAHVPPDRALRRWARAALARPATITLRFATRSEARRLNRRFLGKDHATNVLSFPYALPRAGPVAGDIVICPAVVAREARAQARPLAAHYAHLVVHGLLHLQGYDHVRDADARRMERRERAILARLGYANPYART